MDSVIVDLLGRLIQSAPTCQNGELNAANVLHRFFQDHHITSRIDTWDGSRANVIAHLGPETCDIPTLVIGSHIDVVPAGPENWKTDPFDPVEKDGSIIGRGSVDMLGGICACAGAMVDLQKSGKTLTGRVLFAATAGEETDSCGVKRFIRAYSESVKHPIGILIPEPSNLRLLRAHRGILWLKITLLGRTAHGSMPQLGINAIEKANLLLNHLKNWQIPHTPHDLLGGCSMSVNRISGGSATNIVPDSCSIELDLRTLPDQPAQDIISDIEKLIAEIAHTDPEFKADLSILRSCPAMETKADDPFLKKVAKATGIRETFSVGFTTDGPLFARLGAPVLIFGPGNGTCCHQPNETLEIAQLEKAKTAYFNIMQALLTE